MRKQFVSVVIACMTLCVSAQVNMEAFRHLSVGVEAGLQGFGVELAIPIQKHFVLKAGYNWMPSGDLLTTDLNLSTSDLKIAQEQYENRHPSYKFTNRFDEESKMNAGLQLGLTNFKAMINWYPVVSGRFYIVGGVYYTPEARKDDPFIGLNGHTLEKDQAALEELNRVEHEENSSAPARKMYMKIGNESYAVDADGNMAVEFKMDPLKYYVGMGVGRCIPNRLMGLQLEVGTMIYRNSVLKCQDREVGSITVAAESLGNDAKEILDYVDKYPIYPQVTLRLSFRLF